MKDFYQSPMMQIANCKLQWALRSSCVCPRQTREKPQKPVCNIWSHTWSKSRSLYMSLV